MPKLQKIGNQKYLPSFYHCFAMFLPRACKGGIGHMNEMTLSSLIQIMQDGFIQHDKQESAGRFLLESMNIQEDSLCATYYRFEF